MVIKIPCDKFRVKEKCRRETQVDIEWISYIII